MPAPRVLIITADIGAGHDLPAKLLADAIRAREPGAEVVVADGLEAMGPLVRAVLRSGAETILVRLRPLYDLQYWLALRFPPTRWLAGLLLTAFGAPGLLRLVAATRPDVVVSTYPGTTEILGRMRRAGRLRVPAVAAVTDLSALPFWVNPGIDLHLMIHEESRAEAAEIAGPAARMVAVTGLTRPEFEAPPARDDARAALGLPTGVPVVLVSGGGWGVGDLEAAARVTLAIPDAVAVCLCGTNEGLRRRLERAFAGEPRVRLEGFTDRMADWMAAADVLVHSTAGLTVLEAELCGTWAISYGWGVGHLRLNNAAYRRLGLAEVAATTDELGPALRRALAAPRARTDAYARRPAAADEVLALTPPRRSATA